MVYEPLEPPVNTESLPTYLRDEFMRIATAIMADPTYSAAQLLDKGNVINARLKGEAVRVWDSTNKRPVWASGKNPTDAWVDSNGNVVHTPV